MERDGEINREMGREEEEEDRGAREVEKYFNILYVFVD